jgi:hypothetical protein
LVDEDDGAALESRPPTVDDLVALCRNLTEDIDLLVDSSPENFERLRAGMLSLPDQAIREVQPTDLDDYVVVRVADEIVVDLMKAACGVEYDDAAGEIEHISVNGVDVPFASAELMLRLKQTAREKDRLDRQFLEQLLRGDS